MSDDNQKRGEDVPREGPKDEGKPKRGKRGSKGKKPPTRTGPPGNNPPPTFQQRAAQLRALEGAPVEPPAVVPMPLQALSAAMDALYPTSMEPHTPPQHVMLDCSGYLDLCSVVYHTLLHADDKLERYLSEPEFLLCCGQILARHVLWIRTYALNVVIPGQMDLFESIPTSIPIAAPIAQYIEGIGMIRHTTGEILVPNLTLPRSDIGNAPFHAGMLPSLYSDAYTTNTTWSLNSAMIQFGLLMRAIINAHAGNAYGHGHALDRLDANNANAQNDAHLARPCCLPRFTMLQPMHRDRVGKLLQPFRVRNGNFLEASLCWNAQLFQQYVLFMDRAANKIAMSSLPRTTAGTAAYLAWATPENGDDISFPTRFFYYANAKLSSPEQQAARLFRYRQSRPRDDNCSEGNQSDRTAAYVAAPASLQGPTMTITAVDAYPAFLGQYVRYFVKN